MSGSSLEIGSDQHRARDYLRSIAAFEKHRPVRKVPTLIDEFLACGSVN